MASSAWIYLAFLAATTLFFGLKPFDFPDIHAEAPAQAQGVLHWVRTAFWQIPLEAGWIVFLVGLARFFQTGNLVVRLVQGVAWVAFPIILIVLHAQAGGIGRPAFLVGSALWLAAFYPLLRQVSREDWKALAGFMLAINVIGLAILIPMTGAAVMRTETPYLAVQAVGGLWVLGAGTLGLRELVGLRLPRAFMTILLSLFFQVALCFTLYLSGLFPREILKALFYA